MNRSALNPSGDTIGRTEPGLPTRAFTPLPS
jgi:hypothetical protein